ncbi:MAG: hypothetical protein CM15mV19_1550 [uncultured marine virus]|nr:MAG: hypothetical protein CM15mV19_1550 [uncultured marine virus]
MTCKTSISDNVNAFDGVYQSVSQNLLGCSGLVEPASSVPLRNSTSVTLILQFNSLNQ